MKKHIASLSFATLLITACDVIPPQAYFEHGTPESLMDSTSEVVNVALADKGSIAELTDWVNQDQPTRAELYCTESDKLCDDAEDVLAKFGVEAERISSSDATIALVYDRVAARDCENRYIDNAVNPYNLNHPTFGCTIASNMVQMISDKRQIVNPALLDPMDGEKAVQIINKGFRQPNAYQPPNVTTEFKSQFELESGG